jgi:phage antirepressor YoqD-like protein
LNLGLFEIKKTIITRPDGTSLIITTPKVTGKGQVYFVNKFLYETINEAELVRQKAEREAKKGGAQ